MTRAVHFSILSGMLGLLVCGWTAAWPHASLAESGTLQWSKSTAMPEPRAGYASGVLDGKLVIAGGSYWEGTKGNWIKKHFSSSVHAFDPITERWERLPDSPIPFSYASSTVVNQRLYVLGGYTGQKENRQILTLEKKGDRYIWETAGELPDTRLFAWAGSIGGSIYLLGGVQRFEPLDATGTCCTSVSATNRLSVWDPAAPHPQWKDRAPFPGAKRWSFAAATDESHIWLIGGQDSDAPKQKAIQFDEVLEYSVADDRWRQRDPLPPEVISTIPLTPLYLDDKLLLVSFSKTVWQLDLASGQTTRQTPLLEDAMVDSFFWIDGRIVGAGGENKIESPRRRSEWTFIGRFVPGTK